MQLKTYNIFFVIMTALNLLLFPFSSIAEPGGGPTNRDTKNIKSFKDEATAKKSALNKNQCAGIACTMDIIQCADTEVAVDVKTSGCCPKWQCQKRVTGETEPNPMNRNCPDAPAVMRSCNNGQEAIVSRTTDNSGCTITTQTCPEDLLSAPSGTSGNSSSGTETSNKADKKKILRDKNGNVIQ